MVTLCLASLVLTLPLHVKDISLFILNLSFLLSLLEKQFSLDLQANFLFHEFTAQFKCVKVSDNGINSSLSGNTLIFPLDRGKAMGINMKFQENYHRLAKVQCWLFSKARIGLLLWQTLIYRIYQITGWIGLIQGKLLMYNT